jgi:hypothetical protein
VSAQPRGDHLDGAAVAPALAEGEVERCGRTAAAVDADHDQAAPVPHAASVSRTAYERIRPSARMDGTFVPRSGDRDTSPLRRHRRGTRDTG